MREKVENFFLWKWLLQAERFIMILSSVMVVITITAVVVSRYFLHINFRSSNEILVIFALWLYFTGGIYGNYKDCHIKADVLSIMLKDEKALHVSEVISKIISLVVSAFLAVWAFQYLDFCIKVGGKTQVLHLPMLLSRGALVVGYVLPVLYNVYHVILILTEKPRYAEKVDDTCEGGDVKC